MCLILEYVPEYPDFPVVLLSDSTPEKAEKLSQALSILVADNNAVVDIHALPFISSVDGGKLSAQVIDEDVGAVLIENTKNHFAWQMTSREWEWILALLDRFTEPDCSGYQYLGPYEEECDPDVLSDIQVIFPSYYRKW